MKPTYIYSNADMAWFSTSEPNVSDLTNEALVIWRVTAHVIDQWDRHGQRWLQRLYDLSAVRYIYRRVGRLVYTPLHPAHNGEYESALRIITLAEGEIAVERWHDDYGQWREITKMRRHWVIV